MVWFERRKLALKHPTKTTIVQMDKDGAYRVVYGTQLKNITGKVKMVAVSPPKLGVFRRCRVGFRLGVLR
jgi:hypothetical protein